MKATTEIADALELFSSSTVLERSLRFKTQDGTAICLTLGLSASDSISEVDWENAQMKFQDLQSLATKVFQRELE